MDQERPANAKAKLVEVNSYLTCPLCKGYFIDATTIVECLHSFCKSCIIQHLQVDNYCPICDLMINTVKPNIKPDKTLQDIVYKLVPGLYTSEMARRRKFWAEHPDEAAKVACPEARGLMTERIIFSPQDAISLSIEYTSDDPCDDVCWNRSEPDPEVPLRRYLQCPAMLRVEHLKKFICNKYNVDSQLFHVDILYKRVPLPDHYTLMDIAYIYSWKRNEPMKFFFRITDINLVSERFDYFEPSAKQNEDVHCQQQRTTKQNTNNDSVKNNNNISKKKVFPDRLPEEKQTSKEDKKIVSKKEINKIVKSDEKQKCADIKNEKSNKDEKVISDTCVTKKIEKVKNDKKEYVENDNKLISENKENDNKSKVDEKVSELKVDENDKTVSNSVNQVENTKTKVPTNSITNNNLDKKNPEKPEIAKSSENDKSKSEEKLNLEDEIKAKMETTPILIDEDPEKSQFLMSIQLTAKNASPPSLKPISLEINRPKIPPSPAPKRKYTKRADKQPVNKKQKLSEKKIRKIAPKDSKICQLKNIKNPHVWSMVSNLNKQATNMTKIVNQTENEQLQTLIDSCKLNIPSSLSITLTESPRNEDGTYVESKPVAIKPVQNYIEILKLPDKSLPEGQTENTASLTGKNMPTTPVNRSQKHTFQTMFEETIKRDESMKAQLVQILNNARTMEFAKTSATSPKMNKKQEGNALDLSKTSPKSSPPSPTSSSANPDSNKPKLPQTSSSLSPNSVNSNNKRNILEIAHQLSKKSRIESTDAPTKVAIPKISPKEEAVAQSKDSPPKQIVINTNFSSGGSVAIKRSPKKLPLPRLPISKVPTPKLHPPNIRNGGLLKFKNYTAKLATNNSTNKSPPKGINSSPNGTKPETPNTMLNMSPNQLLEKYNISNLAQYNANLNQFAIQQALMLNQLEMHHRMQQQNNQKHWMNNPNILAHYENYVQSLKNQQNSICGNANKN